MKLLLQKTSSIILNSLYNCLSQVAEQYIEWNSKTQSMFEILDTYKPNLIFIGGNEVTNSTIEAIKEYNIPTVVYGFMSYVLPQTKLHIIPSTINSKLVQNLTTDTYILKYGTNLVHNIPSYIPYSNVLVNTLQNNDLGKILNTIQELQKHNIAFIVLGKEKLPIVEHLGTVTVEDLIGLKDSQIIILNGPEYIYDMAYNKAFVITLNVENELYPNCLTVQELIEKINLYTNNPKLKASIIKNAYKIASQNTYYHRAYDVLKILNYNQEATACLSKASGF